MAILALVALVMVVAVLPLGSFGVPYGRVWSTLFHPADASADEMLIVWTFRVPRILLALMVGGMLGLAGACMQSVTRNGLADPGLIGVTEGATVAILLTVVLGLNVRPDLYPLLGMVGGGTVAGIVLLLTGRAAGIKFILVGIGVSAFLSASIALFITYGRIDEVHSAMVWMAGSLSPATWATVGRALPWAVIGLLLAIVTTRASDIGMLGHNTAIALGIRMTGLRLALIFASVTLTSASVAAVGTLGFVGLIAPHIARFLLGSNQASLIGGSAASGALLVLIADSIGRLTFAPLQIPAGIVMALIGVPFFLWLLWRRRHAL